MTITELEQELKKLSLADRAKLLSRLQLTDEERDELDDLRDLNDTEVVAALAESREDARTGRTRALSEFMAELDAEERLNRRA